MRVGPKGAAYFHGWVDDQIPEELRDALRPILTTVGEQIALLDKEIERLAKEVYPVTALLRQVGRVGLHTSIRFVLPVAKILRGSRKFAAWAPTSVSVHAGIRLVPASPSCASRRPGSAGKGICERRGLLTAPWRSREKPESSRPGCMCQAAVGAPRVAGRCFCET